ncbi:pentapeptide repeat-containing protein [Agromyces tardus]|uniref:Pentapeptide repeat-containing protein n=1 Tax=Agromyces tardus TaxID=2583849 RepID=A0A3M8A8D2_9MICO|nr:pentapeptide repeat-containing protein [Agromyces tardus]RNB47418.1 pentapeptide repeat-containing protein [Agromyces tardus]
MRPSDLRARWQTPRGRPLQVAAVGWLLGRTSRPIGLGNVEGRVDLRGLTFPGAEPGGVVGSGGLSAITRDWVPTIRRGRWRKLDLSYSRLSQIRFFDSAISDCVFDGAECRDWRMWRTKLTDSSFTRTDLRESALGTWQQGAGNTWRGIRFDGADLRDGVFWGAAFTDCAFIDCRLRGVQFEQCELHRCEFQGDLRDVLFDCRQLPGKREVGPLKSVDFREARFEDVEFRGSRFEPALLPHDVKPIRNYPSVARQIVALLANESSTEARIAVAILVESLRMPGREDSVAVYNRGDYLRYGGEPLAALMDDALERVGADTSVEGRRWKRPIGRRSRADRSVARPGAEGGTRTLLDHL